MTIKCKYRIRGMTRSLFEALSFTCTMYVFIYYLLKKVQAYLHSMHNLAVTFTLTPVLQKVENRKLSKRLEAFSIEFDFYKIQC